jgi:hypothetical protein
MVVKQQLFKNFWLFLLVVTYVAFALFLSGSMLELLSSSSDLKSPSVAEIMFNQAVLNVTNWFQIGEGRFFCCFNGKYIDIERKPFLPSARQRSCRRRLRKTYLTLPAPPRPAPR